MLHKIQIATLEKLLFQPKAKFQELNVKKIPTDQFSYHISKLKKEGYLIKDGVHYSLTDKGKDFAGRIDTETHKYLDQPKIGVELIVTRNVKEKNEILIGKRLKGNSKDLWGPYTRKIQYREPLEDSIVLCLESETGLTPLKWNFVGISRFSPGSELDVILLVFHITKYKGIVFPKTKDSENKWIEISKVDYNECFKGLSDLINEIQEGPNKCLNYLQEIINVS